MQGDQTHKVWWNIQIKPYQPIYLWVRSTETVSLLFVRGLENHARLCCAEWTNGVRVNSNLNIKLIRRGDK